MVLLMPTENPDLLTKFFVIARNLKSQINIVPITVKKKGKKSPKEEQFYHVAKFDKEYVSEPRLFIFRR